MNAPASDKRRGTEGSSRDGRPRAESVRPHLVRRRMPFTVLLSRVLNALRLADLPEHRRRVAASRRILAKLSRFEGEAAEARRFAYLRAIDPLVFEEVVLSAIEDAGHIVLRNRAYTGDGGVDGRVVVPGTLGRIWAVQVKRYAATVTPDHVAGFVATVREGGYAGGIFVHCGRTGPMAYRWMAGTAVELISGSALLELLRRR